MDGIPLRLIELPEVGGPHLGEESPLRPGDCWRDHECWAVVLPNMTIWYSGIASASGSMWTTTGDAPNLTVTPSIDDQDPGRPWHGFIRDGRLVGA